MSNPAHILRDPTLIECMHTADTLPQFLSPRRWSVDYLAGKLAELRSAAAPAVLTAGMNLVLKAQTGLETAVWVTSTESIFFPEDAQTWGVDLDAMAVVRVPGAAAMLQASDKLIRSGAFGLIILDFVSPLPSPMGKGDSKPGAPGHVSFAQQARFLGLAKKHQTALVFLTSTHSPLSGASSLVSLRGEVGRRHADTDIYKVRIHILKDKQHGPGWHHEERCLGPDGLY